MTKLTAKKVDISGGNEGWGGGRCRAKAGKEEEVGLYNVVE